jgi:signal transduction histidine kinase/DNA-binding response OmpR family regulator
MDHEEKLWLGTYYGGLNVFDGKKFFVYKYNPNDSTSISDDRVWGILEDHNKELWIATLNGGLNRFDRKTNRFIRYINNPAVTSVAARYIPFINEDREGNLWMGTGGGLLVFNKSRTGLKTYRSSADTITLSHDNATDWMEDNTGLIWVGTRNGLNVFNKKKSTFKRFTTEDGLPDNEVISITEDKTGDLWLTTAKGLCQLLVRRRQGNVSFEVRNFSEMNNLQGTDFNTRAGLLTTDGTILLGGTNGFNLIYPNKIIYRNVKPKLVFTNVEILNNELNVGQELNKNIVLRNALLFADEIVLHHNENIFSIEFAALDFSGNNQYAYKLEGFNNRWIHAGSDNRKVTYTNLDPGTYYFKVKTTNSAGVWSDEIKTLKIIIKPPFWRSWFAFLLYGLLVAAGLYLYRKYALEKARMRFEVEQQKKEAERMQTIDAIKTKVFTNVSHEFRTPLSLILTPLDKLNNSITDPELNKQVRLVQRNAKRLLNLVNQLLDFRKMEVQEFELQVTEGNIIKFTKEIVWSFSDLAELKAIEMVFTSNVENLITYFDKDKLEKILFNLLSNALKYTGNKGFVLIDLQYQEVDGSEHQLVLTVKDSGIGIPEDKQEKVFERFFQNDIPANIANPGTGIGLAITKEFVRLHNGTIKVQSEVNKGTIFEVTLPIQKPEIQQHGISAIEERSEAVSSAEHLPIPEKQTGLKSERKTASILLVEDNDDFRFYLKDNLQQLYDIDEAINGQEAWEKLQNSTPDLIVSDIMMPFMDGIELTSRIKKSVKFAHLPIILLTAIEDEELQQESVRLGVSDFMTKPFIYDMLALRVKNILNTRREIVRRTAKIIEISPSEIHIEPEEELYMKKVLEIIENNISNADFSIEDLSKAMFVNRVTLYRRLLALTGKSPLELVRNVRLKRAYQILQKSKMTVAEVAYEVGFNSPKKFSLYFKEEYGVTPSQFQKQSKGQGSDSRNEGE